MKKEMVFERVGMVAARCVLALAMLSGLAGGAVIGLGLVRLGWWLLH